MADLFFDLGRADQHFIALFGAIGFHIGLAGVVAVRILIFVHIDDDQHRLIGEEGDML